MFFVEALNFTFTLFPPLPLKDGLKAQEHIVKVTFKIEAMSGMGYFFSKSSIKKWKLESMPIILFIHMKPRILPLEAISSKSKKNLLCWIKRSKQCELKGSLYFFDDVPFNLREFKMGPWS